MWWRPPKSHVTGYGSDVITSCGPESGPCGPNYLKQRPLRSMRPSKKISKTSCGPCGPPKNCQKRLAVQKNRPRSKKTDRGPKQTAAKQTAVQNRPRSTNAAPQKNFQKRPNLFFLKKIQKHPKLFFEKNSKMSKTFFFEKNSKTSKTFFKKKIQKRPKLNLLKTYLQSCNSFTHNITLLNLIVSIASVQRQRMGKIA